jgi:hypothetical protein
MPNRDQTPYSGCQIGRTASCPQVLNVDGCIGTLFLDLLHSSSMFTADEIRDVVKIGYLNGLFVLARSIGLIGVGTQV